MTLVASTYAATKLSFFLLDIEKAVTPGFQWFVLNSGVDFVAEGLLDITKLKVVFAHTGSPMTCQNIKASRKNAKSTFHVECTLTFCGTYDIEFGKEKFKYIHCKILEFIINLFVYCFVKQDPTNMNVPSRLSVGATTIFTADNVRGIKNYTLDGIVGTTFINYINENTMSFQVPVGFPIGNNNLKFFGRRDELLFGPLKVQLFAISLDMVEVVDFVDVPTIKITGKGLENLGSPPIVKMTDTTVNPPVVTNCFVKDSSLFIRDRVFNPTAQKNIMVVYTKEIVAGVAPQFYASTKLLTSNLLAPKVLIFNDYYYQINVDMPAETDFSSPNANHQYDIVMVWSPNPPVVIPSTSIPISFSQSNPVITKIYPPAARYSFQNFATDPVVTQITIYGTGFDSRIAPQIQFTGEGPFTGTFDCETIQISTSYLTCFIKSQYEIDTKVRLIYNSAILSAPFPFTFFGLSCLGRSPDLNVPNLPVDWSFTYKFRQNDKTPIDEKDSYLYIDNKYDLNVERHQGLTDITRSLSPMAATFDQIKYGYSYYFYNDQVGMRNPDGSIVNPSVDPLHLHSIYKNSDPGHTKGLVIYDHDTGSGLHIIHSQPYWPAFTYNGPNAPNPGVPFTKKAPYDYYEINTPNWLGDKNLNQHFYCYTFGPSNDDKTGINIVSQYIGQNMPLIFQSVNKGVATRFTLLYKLIATGSTNDGTTLSILPIKRICDQATSTPLTDLKDKCWWHTDMTTKSGIPLNIFSKSSNTYHEKNVIMKAASHAQGALNVEKDPNIKYLLKGFDIYEKMLETFNPPSVPLIPERPFFVQSLQMGGSRRAYQRVDPQKLLANVEDSLETYRPEYLQEGYVHHSDRDHSKLMFNMRPQPWSNERFDNIFCAGDSNRHHGQGIRGGGAACFVSKELVSYFTNRVGRYSNINRGALQHTFVIQSHKMSTLPTWLRMAVISIKITTSDLIPTTIPEGSLFETLRQVAFDGVTNEIIPTYPATLSVLDKKETFSVTIPIYRSLPSSQFEWALTWPVKTKSHVHPIIIRQLMAMKTPKFELCYCAAEPCNLANAMRLDTRIDVASGDLFEDVSYYALQTYQNYLSYAVPAENPLIFINEYLRLVQDKILLPSIPSFVIVQSNGPTRLQNNILYLKDLTCKEEVAYALTLKIIDTLLLGKTDVDKVVLQGMAWAVSKVLTNLVTLQGGSIVSECFSENPEGVAGIDLEGSQNRIPPPTAYWYAATFWDWMDILDDDDKGPYPKSKIGDSNKPTLIPWINFLVNVRSCQTIKSLYDSLGGFLNTANKNIMFYNGYRDPSVPPAPVVPPVMASRFNLLFQLTSDNIPSYTSDVLKELLVDPGYFTIDQLNDLDQTEMDKIFESLALWHSSNVTNYGIKTILEAPKSSAQANKPLQFLSSLLLINPLEPFSICESSDPSILRLCDPFSLVSLTNLLQTHIYSHHELLSLESDLKFYYIDSKTAGSPVLAIATLKGRICDFTLVTPPLNTIQIQDSLCLGSGPVIYGVSAPSLRPTNGNYPLDVYAFHIKPGMIVSIGDQDCLQSNYINSTYIQCVVPPGSGIQFISIYDESTDSYDSQSTGFTFSYDLPTVDSISPIIIPTSGSQLTINGKNFGTDNSTISATFGNIRLNLVSVNHTSIIVDIPAGTGSKLFISLKFNGYTIPNTLTFSYQVPVITSFTPTTGNALDILRIDGSGFGANVTGVKVFVGIKECTILSVSDSIINCRLPVGIANKYISIQTPNTQLVMSSQYFRYKSSVINSQSASIPTLGGLMQFRGSSFGDSLNDIVYAKFDSQAIDCKSFNIFTECMIPKGINNNIELKIASCDYLNTTLVNVYQNPVITSLSAIPQLNSLIIGGSNLIPNQLPYDQNSWIELTNQQSQITKFNETFVNEAKITVSTNVLQSQFTTVKVVVGGRPSNVMNIQYDFNVFVQLYQDNNFDGIRQPNEPLLTGTVIFSTGTINQTISITGSGGVLTTAAGIYSTIISVGSNFVAPLNNFKVEVFGSITNQYYIPIWEKKSCVKSYTATDGQTIVTLQEGTINLRNYGICSNTQNCLYPITVTSPPQCIATSTNDVVTITQGIPLTLTFYMDNNLNGIKDANENAPDPNVITIIYSKDGSGINNQQLVSSGQETLYVSSGLLKVSFQFDQYSKPTLYSIVSGKAYDISGSVSDSFGFYKWNYDSVPPVAFYNSLRYKLSLPVGKYNLQTLQNMGWSVQSNKISNGIITAINAFNNNQRVTFSSSSTDINSVVLQTNAPSEISVSPFSNVLIEVSYIPMFNSFTGLDQAGGQTSTEFFSPYLTLPSIYYGTPSFSNLMNCQSINGNQSRFQCIIPQGRGTVQLSMKSTSPSQEQLYPFSEYKMLYTNTVIQGTVYEDTNANNQKASDENGIAGIVVKLGTTFTTTTNAAGFYSFTVPSDQSSYVLSVVSTATFLPTNRNYSQSNSIDTKKCQVTLTSGTKTMYLQYGTFNLADYGWCNPQLSTTCTMSVISSTTPPDCAVDFNNLSYVRVRYANLVNLNLYIDQNLDNIINDGPSPGLFELTVTKIYNYFPDNSYSLVTYTGSTKANIDVTNKIMVEFTPVINTRPVVSGSTHIITNGQTLKFPFFKYQYSAPSQKFFDQPGNTGQTLELPIGVYENGYLSGLPVSWVNKVKSFTVATSLKVLLVYNANLPDSYGVVYTEGQQGVPSPNLLKFVIFSDTALVTNNINIPNTGGSFIINNWSSQPPQVRYCPYTDAPYSICPQLADQSKYQCSIPAGTYNCKIEIKYGNLEMYGNYQFTRIAPTITGFVKQPSRTFSTELLIKGENFPPSQELSSYYSYESSVKIGALSCELLSFINSTTISCLTVAFGNSLPDASVISLRITNQPNTYTYNFNFLSSKCAGAQIKNGFATYNYAIGTSTNTIYTFDTLVCSWFCYCTVAMDWPANNQDWNVAMNSMTYSAPRPISFNMYLTVSYAKCISITLYRMPGTPRPIPRTFEKGTYTFDAAEGMYALITPQIGCKVILFLDDITALNVVSSFDPLNFPNYRWKSTPLSKIIIYDSDDYYGGNPVTPTGPLVSSPPLLGMAQVCFESKQ
ncbi:hypothetical protein PPL_01502 [Heterostelium album PN500]|uniref:IPT/TIG domain-containing protein n=1 Tax=Heterostelium pallidum (strain ATCC 26659 / Pp 5 / PN500) TaxID=670386 RepID=D3AZG1_HETP5|nr:hypothetical protein PPL_01502 [Heterostelium album PN500]EFA85544.1 hypothetical protein PPL_01502 [Heterostelium album PN500]|eukprot:XP_020437652.1 hypothetical protein PPL_01502 [Heterostelium album PN500]